MSKKIYVLAAFAVGAASGFFAGKLYFADRYEALAITEIEAVKDYYKRKTKEPEQPAKDPVKPEPEKTTKYATLTRDLGYTNAEKRDTRRPFVISPDLYGTNDDYDHSTLTYYKDGIMADEDDVVMNRNDIERAVGLGAIDHFGDFEDDSVFVRNPIQKIDFEIQRDNRTYVEVVGEKPYIVEE